MAQTQNLSSESPLITPSQDSHHQLINPNYQIQNGLSWIQVITHTLDQDRTAAYQTPLSLTKHLSPSPSTSLPHQAPLSLTKRLSPSPNTSPSPTTYISPSVTMYTSLSLPESTHSLTVTTTGICISCRARRWGQDKEVWFSFRTPLHLLKALIILRSSCTRQPPNLLSTLYTSPTIHTIKSPAFQSLSTGMTLQSHIPQAPPNSCHPY